MRQRDGVGLCVCTMVGAGLRGKGSVNNLLLVVADARPVLYPYPCRAVPVPHCLSAGCSDWKYPVPLFFPQPKTAKQMNARCFQERRKTQ